MTEALVTKSARPLTPEEAARLWTPEETAKYLGLSSADVLAIWRCTQRYNLPFANIGGKIMYDPILVRRWVESRTTGEDGVTPKGVKRRRSGSKGMPKGGWPSMQKKRSRRLAP